MLSSGSASFTFSWARLIVSLSIRKALPFLIAILAFAARVIPGPRTIDDAFITFRYARSILAGTGFAYNPGEHILGTTTPLYTLLMAGIGTVTGRVDAPFPWIALLVNALADVLACILLWRIGRQIGTEGAGFFAAAAWAIAPFSVTFAIGGMETSVYVALLLLIIWAFMQGNLLLTGAASILAYLTRPDALILISLIFAYLIIRYLQGERHSALWLGFAIFLVIFAGWSAFSWINFGTILPHSITAKSMAYQLKPEEGLIRLLQHYATPFMDETAFGGLGTGYGLFLYPFLAVVGSVAAIKINRKSIVWISYPWVYFILFAAFNPLIFRWYLTPPLPVYILLICTGGAKALQMIGTRIFRGALEYKKVSRMAGINILFGMLPLFLLGRTWQIHPDHGPDRPAPDMAYIQLELLYRQAAEILAPSIQPGDVLAAGDVGVLGFDTGAQILDTVGLNTPQAAIYYPADPDIYTINYAIPQGLILDNRPDFVVILEVYGRKGLLQSDAFIQDYRLVEKIPTDIYGSDGMLIFARADGLTASGIGLVKGIDSAP